MQGRHKGMEEICYWVFIGWGGEGIIIWGYVQVLNLSYNNNVIPNDA